MKYTTRCIIDNYMFIYNYNKKEYRNRAKTGRFAVKMKEIGQKKCLPLECATELPDAPQYIDSEKEPHKL